MSTLKNILSERPELALELRRTKAPYEIAKKLFAAKKQQKVSMDDIQRITGLTRKNVIGVFSADENMRLSHVMQVAKALGVVLKVDFEPESS